MTKNNIEAFNQDSKMKKYFTILLLENGYNFTKAIV